MRTLRDRPIKQKLIFIAMITSAASLMVAGTSIVLVDSLLFRSYLKRDLSALTRIIADNSTGALAFNDPEAAAQTLGALRARPHVSGACIYRLDSTILAKYSRAGEFTCPLVHERELIEMARDGITVSQPVLLKGRRIGTLVLLYDLGEISERVMLYGLTVLAVLVGAGLLAFLLASSLRSMVAGPIAALVHATTSVSETGDYTIRAEKLTHDELGLLVDRFNEMLSGIARREDDLKKAVIDRENALRDVEKQRERFRFMAESMPQKIFTATPTGGIDYFNAQWMEFTGLTFEQIKAWGWTQFVHPEDLEENIRVWRHSVETGEPFHFEHRFRRADGAYRWHLSRALPMRDEIGRIVMWIGSNTEIHEQKEKETELRRANEDLQQFAYSASHDLQEPIRNVAVYSEIVAAHYGDLLDADGRQFLGFIKEGGRRLATLVNDLLVYTRASMMELTGTSVDAEAALKRSLSDLCEPIRLTGATVTYEGLPEVYMGEAHLQLVFQNLIGNALKYKGREQPRIHVSVKNLGDQWCFSVQDNGIGIDPQYKEKIFGVFKRLHHGTEYSGTGIGLAICQRVIQRYGGRIWVESRLGDGATFYFSVPRGAGRGLSEKRAAG